MNGSGLAIAGVGSFLIGVTATLALSDDPLHSPLVGVVPPALGVTVAVAPLIHVGL